MRYQKKTKPALWTTMRGGVKPRTKTSIEDSFEQQPRKRVSPISATRRESLARYRLVAMEYKAGHPLCHACRLIFNRRPKMTEDIHHKNGRAGTLLTDTRFYLAACRECHNWIGENPERARALGLLCKAGSWNRPVCPTCANWAGHHGGQCPACLAKSVAKERSER